MPRVLIDDALERTTVSGFRFPLGVYPVEPMKPAAGVFQQFEAADGAEPFLTTHDGGPGDDWEEWPDRFMFDVLLSAEHIPSFTRAMLPLFPGRVYPILDLLGSDAYREVDPYIAYDLVGLDRFVQGLIHYGPWFYEDGLVGFGAMSMEPFVYMFIDEHKIATVRVELDLKERVEKILAAFDLPSVPEVAGVDTVAHEHRTVLAMPDDDPTKLGPEDIVEHLRHQWLLQLNVNGENNVDDEGRPLGITAWRCMVRAVADEDAPDRYAEVLLTAPCLDDAEDLASDAVATRPPTRGGDEAGWLEIEPVSADRLTPQLLAELLREPAAPELDPPRVLEIRWEDPGPPGSATPRGPDAAARDRPAPPEGEG